MIALIGAVAAPGRAAAAHTPAGGAIFPAGYDASRKYMLVVLLHGCTQDAADIARGTRVAEHADRDAFIVLLPEQAESANAKKCWNWYDPAHQSRDAGEPSIIAGMTTRIVADYP